MTVWGWWPDRQAMVSDAALALAVTALEILLELHTADMGWHPAALVVRIPVMICVIVLRRRLPVLMLALAVADTAFQGQVSAVLPVAAYAVPRYREQRAVRIPVLVLASVGTWLAVAGTWGWHTGVIVSGCFVLWPATLGAYIPARTQVLAAAVERAERAEATQELLARKAVLQERTRIAGEMHDIVGHRVSLMVLHAGALEMAAADAMKVRLLAEQTQAAGRQALQELRQLVGLLREPDAGEPAPLAPQPRLTDLAELVQQSRAAGMAVTLEPTGEVRVLTELVERTAYRVVQESLTNAGRHAPGGSVSVTLDYQPAALAVRVINERATRPSTTVAGQGSGLVGLRERTIALGGHLHADPRLDGGFAVEAVLPT